MYDALVWDSRDAGNKYPESSVGTYATMTEAWEALCKYLATANYLYLLKAEVVEVK